MGTESNVFHGSSVRMEGFFLKENKMAVYDLVKDYHALGDGKCDDSLPLSRAFASLNEGDELHIPSGVYRTAPLSLSVNAVTISFERGAVLSFIDDPKLYPPVATRWEGVMCHALHPCFFIHDCRGVRITGLGVLNGNGKSWWDTAREKKTQTKPESALEQRLASLNPGYESQSGGGGGRASQFLRPPLFQILHAEEVTVEDITLKDSPFWTFHPVLSKHLAIRNIHIDNPSDAPNTDGIDVDSCQDVEISGCEVHVGDDGIALKSGAGEDALRVGVPTSHVRIHDCTVRSAHGGAVIGSETGAGINDITVENCLFDGTDRGIRIKTRRGRAGDIQGLVFRNITMRHTLCPITVNMYYVCGTKDRSLFALDAVPVTDTTPSIRNVTIEQVKADDVRSSCGFIVGLPECPITGLSLKDCSFSLAKELRPVEESEMYGGLPSVEGRGIRLRNVAIHMENIQGAGPVIEENVHLD